MKKYIKASKDLEIEDRLSTIISEASFAGYDLSVDNDIQLTFTCVRKIPMPTISTKTLKWRDREGRICYRFLASLKFPDLVSEEKDSADTIQFYLQRWAVVGDFITKLHNYTYIPDMYDEE